MSDPNQGGWQGQAQDPNQGSQPQDPYQAAQPPYGSPENQGPVPPQYGAPQDPYQQAQPPYGAQQGQTPPYAGPQDPYAVPPQYGQPGFQPQYGQMPMGERPGELGDRFLARLLDGLVLGVLVYLVSLIVGSLFSGMIVNSLSTGGSLSMGLWIIAAVSAVLSVAVSLGYFAFMESSRGQTLGKMAMKLWVVGPNGGNPTMQESVKRNIWLGASILQVIPWFGTLLAGLAGLGALISIAVGINNNTTTRQAWNDIWAGTRVVKRG